MSKPTADERGAPEGGEGKGKERWPAQLFSGGGNVPYLLQPGERVVAQPCGFSLAPAPMLTSLAAPTLSKGCRWLCSHLQLHSPEVTLWHWRGFPNAGLPKHTPSLISSHLFPTTPLHGFSCQQKPSLQGEGISCLRRQFFHK